MSTTWRRAAFSIAIASTLMLPHAALAQTMDPTLRGGLSLTQDAGEQQPGQDVDAIQAAPDAASPTTLPDAASVTEQAAQPVGAQTDASTTGGTPVGSAPVGTTPVQGTPSTGQVTVKAASPDGASGTKTEVSTTPTAGTGAAEVAPASVTVSGVVYIDVDRDGSFDAAKGDKPLSGVQVLLGADGKGIDTTTDSNGQFTFPGVQAGPYTVAVTLPSTISAADLANKLSPENKLTRDITLPATAGAADIGLRFINKDCKDFATTAAAQTYFDKYKAYGDVSGLDADNDGKACEAGTSGTTNTQASTTSATGATSSARLANTGSPALTQTAAGLALVGVGAGALTLRRRVASSKA